MPDNEPIAPLASTTNRTEIRSTVVAIDPAILLLEVAVFVLYGIVLYGGHDAPPELVQAMTLVVGAVLGRQLPR